jgi:hypothetical protein
VELTTLPVAYCTFARVELNWLPQLNRLNFDFWHISQDDEYPIYFGNVPHLSVLVKVHLGP